MRTAGEEQVGKVTVEDDAVLSEPSQDRNAGRELVYDDHVERFELATNGPVGGGFERLVDRGEEEGEKGDGRDVKEEAGEEEGEDEVELAEHGADDGEFAEDGAGEDRVAEDVHLERACKYIVSIVIVDWAIES